MGTPAQRSKVRPGPPSMTSPLDRFFRNDFVDLWDDPRMLTVPSINISENRQNYQVKLALPGIKKEDINIEVDGSTITVSSEQNTETSSEDQGEQQYSRREYNYSSFSRSFTIPEDAETEKITAKYCDGELCIKVPRKKENAKSSNRQIKVE